MLITKFYENQEIFVTGASGFIGKALIEKLLRSCPGIGKIYVLLRNKKEKNVEDRLHDILTTSLFDRLREEQPETLKKIYAIKGDCAELGLGISVADIHKLRKVTLIYHSAASVRFDEPLGSAVLLNTRGTHELVKIAETLKQLKVFVHVSTTYCNPDKHVVEEKVYSSYADWRTTIKLAELYNAETLNIFNMKYGKNQPNTYTFTKGLAEQIINDYKDKLPVIIFRPAIVVSSLYEPMPGWIDNFNGPMGMLTACGLGILRTNYADPDNNCAIVPVDIVVRAMLIACYKRSIEKPKLAAKNNVEVINCSNANISPITTGEMIAIGKKYIKENPFEKTLWLPDGSITRCRVWNFIRFISTHILMALVVDGCLILTTEKPFLLKLQRRIYAAIMGLKYFMTTEWVFKNEDFIDLDNLVPQSESQKFGFMHFSNIDYVYFFRNAIRGIKQFLLHESAESSQGAHIRMKFFIVAHSLAIAVGTLYICRFLFRVLYAMYF